MSYELPGPNRFKDPWLFHHVSGKGILRSAIIDSWSQCRDLRLLWILNHCRLESELQVIFRRYLIDFGCSHYGPGKIMVDKNKIQYVPQPPSEVKILAFVSWVETHCKQLQSLRCNIQVSAIQHVALVGNLTSPVSSCALRMLPPIKMPHRYTLPLLVQIRMLLCEMAVTCASEHWKNLRWKRWKWCVFHWTQCWSLRSVHLLMMNLRISQYQMFSTK